jgi:hypothetical protein
MIHFVLSLTTLCGKLQFFILLKKIEMCDIFLILFEEKAGMPLWVGIAPYVTQQLAS